MTDRPPDLADFPVLITLPVQWGDQDAYGHVNNVVYFRWFESARIAYWREIGIQRGGGRDETGPILASVKADYRRQLRFPDEVVVGASITRLGRSSMTMVHRVYSRTLNATAADGESTIVFFDYAAQQSQPIPDHVRARMAALEGQPL